MKTQKLRIFLFAILAFISSITYGQTDDLLVTNLPIVLINTNGQTIPDEPKITAQMGIIYNGPGVMNHQNDPLNNYNGKIGIEVRGQSTQMFPKKCYALETRDATGNNLNVSLLGMPDENDWILYATYTDKSMLRNVVTFSLANSMGNYCTRTAFCEFILNGQYMGVYVLMEKIKKDENRVSIATLNPEDVFGDELTGGYIIRVDKKDPNFQYGTDGWLSNPTPSYPNAMDITFQYYYPDADDIVLTQKNYIKTFISNAEKNLIGTSFKDPDFGYNKYFNTASFVDFLIICELSKEVDKYRYSTYFYKEKDSDGGKLHAGPIWDFDLGYSNVDYWTPGTQYTGWLHTMVEPYEWSIMYWWKRLMEDPYFKNLLKTRWTKLRQNELSNTRVAFVIDSLTTDINAAQQRNYVRWPILGVYVWPNFDWQNNTYADEVAFFENWLNNRLIWMDNNITGTIIHPWAAISGSDKEILLEIHEDYFSRTILKKKYFTLNNAPSGIKIDTIICVNAGLAKIKLTDNIAQAKDLSVTIDKKVINTFQDITSNTMASSGLAPEDENEPVIKIYATGQVLNIECDQPQLLGKTLTVFNLTGQQVAGSEILNQNNQTIPLRLTSGIYLVRVFYNNKPQTRRLTIGR